MDSQVMKRPIGKKVLDEIVKSPLFQSPTRILSMFHTSPGHVYSKLAPWSIGNVELLAEGEGSLTAGGVRKSDKDFALWKASKAGMPYYFISYSLLFLILF